MKYFTFSAAGNSSLFKTRKIVSSNPLLFFLSNEKLKLSQIRIITLRACLRAFLLFLLLSLVFLEEGFADRCFLDLTCRAHASKISVARVAIDSFHGSDVNFLRPPLFFGGSGKTFGASLSSSRSSLTYVSSTRRFHSSHS